MPTRDNPAYRVHRFLSLATQKSRDIAAKDVWSQVFGFTRNDNIHAIYSALMGLHSQVDQAEELIRATDGIDHDLYTRYFPRVRRVLSPPGLSNGWSDHVKSLGPEVLESLEFCGAKIAERYTEEYLQDEELKQLVLEAEDLRQTILNSHLDTALKAELARVAELLRRAFLDYRITGPTAVRDELARALGVLFANREVLVKNPAAQEPLKRFFHFLDKADAVIARVTKYKALVSGGIKLLGLGAGADTPPK